MRELSSAVIGPFEVETSDVLINDYVAALGRGEKQMPDIPRVYPIKWLSHPPVKAELERRIIGLMAQSYIAFEYVTPLRRNERYEVTVTIADRMERNIIIGVEADVRDRTGARVVLLKTDIHTVALDP